jgi:carbamoyl-phosphate synthase small subunit
MEPFFMENQSISNFWEVCFNTGMTGYQEIFTDPSIIGQIMVTTNAHIGNYGVNEMKLNRFY